MPSPFSRLPQPKPDAIFAVSAEARAAGPDAIDGTVGMLLEEDGSVLTFQSVQNAVSDYERQKHRRFPYPLLNGLSEYREAVHDLLGGRPNMASIATTGGTEAVALNLKLLKKMFADARVVVPVPTWANHIGLCEEAGVDVEKAPYLDESGYPTVEGIADAVKRGAHAALLHGGCHNPTGLDFMESDWWDLATIMQESGSVALVDMAYQGFAHDPANDAKPITTLADLGVPTLIAWSASKNHSLYSERTGLAAAVAPDHATQEVINGHYANMIRRIHSASATFGQRIVTLVQREWHDEWLGDLSGARQMLRMRRSALARHLPDSMRGSLDGDGLFWLAPVGTGGVARLKKKKVYLPDDGRVNIGGVPLACMPELGQCITDVAEEGQL